MLRFWKAFPRIFEGVRASRRALGRWWLLMSDDERRRALMRGVSVAACAVSVSVAFPLIGDSYETQREEADARLRTSLFAELRDGGAAMRALPNAPSLIQHPWLVSIEPSLKTTSQPALGRYAARDRDVAAVSTLASFNPIDLSRAEDIVAEHLCLSQAVYYEARSESAAGQLAVAEVIANRVADARYPNSICEVVFQGATRTTGCQFTFTCDGALAIRPRGALWEKAKAVAAQVMMEMNEPRTGSATHYHATYVDPVWNSGLVRTEQIGTHIFYRFPEGREWAEARARLAARRATEFASSGIQTVSADAAPRERDLSVITSTEATAAP